MTTIEQRRTFRRWEHLSDTQKEHFVLGGMIATFLMCLISSLLVANFYNVNAGAWVISIETLVFVLVAPPLVNKILN